MQTATGAAVPQPLRASWAAARKFRGAADLCVREGIGIMLAAQSASSARRQRRA